MSKESALAQATSNQPQTAEVRVNPITGAVPENAKEAANPAVENGGVVPPSLHSTQLSHLAKKEAKLQAEREAFKKEQEEFKSIKVRAQEFYDRAQAFENTRKADPIKAMKELGFSEKEIIDYLAQEEAPKPTTEEVVQAEIKKFKDEEAAKALEAQKKNDDVVVAQFKTQLSDVVKNDPEKYELCTYYGPLAEELMFNIALLEAQEGKTPDAKSIAEDVENYYLEEGKSIQKLKKLTPAEKAELEVPVERTRVVHPPQDVTGPRTRTLTNKIAATSAPLAKPVDRVESREQKRARLEEMIRRGLTR